MTSDGTEAARADVRALLDEKGHAVDVARRALERLDRAHAEGTLERTPELTRMEADLRLALEQDEGQRLGGKSSEAARFILRAIVRELDRA
ncbi:MAG TPA: hypothetical protein VF763_12855 [Candidatus Limnocylindrales bacterium]